MKTVQQVLREMDAEPMMRAFFEEYPINILDIEGYDEEVIITDYKNSVEKKFRFFLERLRSMRVEPGDRQGILFVYKSQTDSSMFLGIDVGLIYADELVSIDNLSDVPTYAYEYTEQKEALAFLVADNELTQNHLMDLVVSFLFEMSWFGYEQEGLREEKEKLERIIDDFKEHPERSVPTNPDDLLHESGLPIEEIYPEEKEKERRWIEAGIDYTSYCRNIELERLKKDILEQGVV